MGALLKLRWISANAYNAQLLATDCDVLSTPCLSLASNVLSTTLQHDHGGKEPYGLPAAGLLFYYASYQLRCVCGLEAPLGCGYTNLMWVWDGWKQKWRTFANDQGFTEENRAIARDVVWMMEFAEMLMGSRRITESPETRQ